MSMDFVEMRSSDFTPSSNDTWEDVNLNTLFGVPVDSVASIMMVNANGSSWECLGVRPKGSSVDTYIDLHEAEGGGETHITLSVQVDSNGLIQIYSGNRIKTWFRVVGYFTGVTFTLDFKLIYMSHYNQWYDADIGEGSRVYEVYMNNVETEYACIYGIRANGSSLDRKLNIHESENGGKAGFTFIVKTDADGYIEYWNGRGVTVSFYVWGYFDSNVDFVEKFELRNNDQIYWQDWSTSGYGTPVSAICSVLLANNYVDDENDIGARTEGSSIDRYFSEHESEPSSTEYTGFSLYVKCGSTSDRIIEIYQNPYAIFATQWFMGWLVYGVPPTGWKALKYYSEPPTTGAWNKLRYASEPPTGGAWNKILYTDE